MYAPHPKATHELSTKDFFKVGDHAFKNNPYTTQLFTKP